MAARLSIPTKIGVTSQPQKNALLCLAGSKAFILRYPNKTYEHRVEWGDNSRPFGPVHLHKCVPVLCRNVRQTSKKSM